MASYSASRDKTENLGNVFHYWVGAREAAQAAAAQANKAREEYEQGLRALVEELGIDMQLLPSVHVQWHTGQVTVDDQQPVHGVLQPV